MDKEFVPYELALALKEIGYQSPNPIGGYRGGAIFYYDKGSELFYDGLPMYSSSYHEGQIIAPLYSQAFRWFREKHGIFSSIWCFETEQKFFIEFGFGIHKFEVVNKEEAELECLKKLIEIVKNSKLC
jgi:hypothetical protein